ncbi:hypothetical protein ACG7TL_007930 [Trametes sanguinea]
MLPILRTNLLHVLPRTPGLPSLNSTFGAILIGSYIGFIIYGLNLYQTLHYFKAFPNDRLYLKILVGIVLALETWHTALCMHTCYHYLVTNYFNPLALLEGSLSVWRASQPYVINDPFDFMTPDLTRNSPSRAQGLSIITCQTFFVRRVYLIVGWRWRILIAAVILFLLAELALAIAATIETFLKPTFAQFEHVTVSVLYPIPGVSVEFTPGGLLTGVFDLLTFIFALIRPNDLIFFGVDIVATKLYPTSLLTALNARHMLAKQSSGAAAIYGESGIISVSTEHKRIYGLNIHQAVRYFKTFPKDHIYLKLLVASVLFWETLHTAFAMHTCYHYLVANYFNSSALFVGFSSLNLLPLVAGSSPAERRLKVPVSRSKSVIQPTDFVWFAINIVATKVYPASLLAALNTRQVLAEQSNGAAAIYGETGDSPTSAMPTRSAFRLGSWAMSGRPEPDEAAGSEVIEMDVKADSFTEKGDTGMNRTVVEIGALDRAGSHSETSSAG